MSHVKRLALTGAVITVLSFTAFAGETPTPPCAPGEMNSPPCTSSQQLSSDDSTVLSQAVTSDSITLTEYTVTEVTIGLLQSALSFF